MPRPMWEDAISFGMVVIPVRMYPATAPRSINFLFLRKKCLARPRQVRYYEPERVYPTDFTIRNTPSRLEETGDLWAGILAAKHDLKACWI